MKLKKLFSFLLCFSMILSLNPLNQTHAAENEFEVTDEMKQEAEQELADIDWSTRVSNLLDNADEETLETVNEYVALQELASKSVMDLEAQGFSSYEIDNIRNSKQIFISHFMTLSHLSEAELVGMGYDENQVLTLKSFTGTEEEITALAATCKITLNIDYVTYTSSTGRTQTRFDYAYRWSGQPLFGLTDIVAIVWADSWIVTGSTNHTLYRYIYNANNTLYRYPSASQHNGDGLSIKFPAKIEDNYYYAAEGGGTFVLQKTGRTDFHVRAEYGHNQLAVTPSVSFNKNGVSISIKFSVSVSSLSSDYKNKFVS